MMRWRAVALWLVLGLVATAASQTAHAQTAPLARLTDRDDLLGWEAAGRLDRGGLGICSAVLVAKDLVLTAAHCIYDSDTTAQVPASELRFRAGFRDGVTIADREVYHAVAHPEYNPHNPPGLHNIRYDVALLRLAAPIPVRDVDPFTLFSGVLTQDRLLVASYGRGRMNALSLEPRCSLLDRRDGIIFFDCNITFGSSGAPVFALAGDTVRLFSIVSSMATMNGRKVGLGMDLPQLVTDLRSAMDRLPDPPVRSRVRRLGSRSEAAPEGSKFLRAKPVN